MRGPETVRALVSVLTKLLVSPLAPCKGMAPRAMVASVLLSLSGVSALLVVRPGQAGFCSIPRQSLGQHTPWGARESR